MSWIADCVKGIVYTVRGKAERDGFELQLSQSRSLILTLEQKIIMLEQENARSATKIHELEIALEVARGENDKLRQREKKLLKEVHEWSSLALEYRPKHLPPLMPPTP